MAISFYYVDTTYVSTDRRSSAVEALKARKVPRRRSVPAADKAVATVLRAVFTGCSSWCSARSASAFQHRDHDASAAASHHPVCW
jgi:hypothetical protein